MAEPDERKHHVHHVVDRDHVEHRVGQPRELGQRPLAVGHDQRIGHLEPVDPARERVAQRGLDDRGSHDRQRPTPAGPLLLGNPLPERLGEGVDIGPAHRPGPRPTQLDQPVVDPGQPRLLGRPGHRLRSLLAVVAGRLIDEGLQLFWGAEAAPPRRGRPRRRDSARQSTSWSTDASTQSLGDAAHVAGRDVDHVRFQTGGPQRGVQRARSTDVVRERLVHRGIERHRRGGVHHDVDRFVDALDGGQVGLQGRRPLGEDAPRLVLPHGGEPGLEDRLAQQPVEPLPGRLGAPGTHDGHYVDVGRRQKSFEHGLAQEPGDAGEQHALRG